MTSSGMMSSQKRRPVMVVSHERSGTHFMMNALAKCYAYISDPWVNLDPHYTPLNYFHPPSVRDALFGLVDEFPGTVVKSHHPADFFAGQLTDICTRYTIIVVHRNPVDTLLSFWRYIYACDWFEGPKTGDAVAFARAQPCGALLRYQTRQYPSMLHRWAAHVDGWMAASRDLPNVVVVRYEDLSGRYQNTIRGLAIAVEQEPGALLVPDRNVNVVPGGPQDPTGRGEPPDVNALRRLCQRTVGKTLTRCGY